MSLEGQVHIAEWSSSVARRAHNPEVAGSNPVSATSSIPGFDIVSNPGIFYPPGKAAAPGIFPEALQSLFRLWRFRCDIAAARGIVSTARWRMAAAHLLCPANKSFYVLFVVS